MKIAHFFIDRPIFAAAVSVIITLLGAIAFPRLAVDQYPKIAPPTVSVSASYPGASAEVMADNVAAPLEQQINGVDDMLYMSSQSIGEGRVSITVTFKLGTDVDMAQVKVQNRVQTALPQLPQEVQDLGVTVRKGSGDTLLIVHVYASDPTLDRKFLANYASLQIRDRLLRVPGVGDVGVNAARDYAMRVWIDPDKAAARDLTVQEIVDALRNNNVQVAAGSVGAPPFTNNPAAQQLIVQTQGKLSTADEFAQVIIKRDAQGRVTRISDIGRVELGAQNYGVNAYKSRERAVALSVTQSPGSNALAVADAVQTTMVDLKRDFPPGIAYEIIYNPSTYIRASVDEVARTLLIAIVLVVIVVILFLQRWRTAVIPLLAIPIALIGTGIMLQAFGFSLNNLSMFGLVLSIGIVVDDAIVVIENVERHISAGLSPREAAHLTMNEVGGALLGIALVLVAVFVPTAFMGGIAGQFYKQFAITIATATLISLVVSLTLSPALAALILKPHSAMAEAAAAQAPRGLRQLGAAGRAFNRGFERFSHAYGEFTLRVIGVGRPILALYAVLLVLTAWGIIATPRGFIPQQDQGDVAISLQLPAGATLARTDAVVQQAIDIVLGTPGVSSASVYAGIDGNGFNNQSSSGQMWAIFEPFATRLPKGLTAARLTADLRRRLSVITAADIRISQPAPVLGLGSAGGFRMIIEDRAGFGYAALEAAARDVAEAAGRDPAITNTYVSFTSSSPRLGAEVDRDKAEMLGVPAANVYATLQTYLAGTYVNNINLLGHTFQVIAMADSSYRQDDSWVGTLKTRSVSGAMVPLSSVVNFTPAVGPYKVMRYNLYPAVDIQGDTRVGASTGQAMSAMERIASARLPAGFTYEWTDLAYQQQLAGNSSAESFVLAVVFVFIFLAALYESLTLPLAVILIVPMCLLAALLGVNLRGTDNNILTQIGMVVLIGLAAKNAILIVEFARQAEERLGLTPAKAAAHAARTRLRPILMTSVAFVAGVAPLAFGSGAGAEMRQALGIAVFFGMLGVTAFGLLFTPIFYVVCRGIGERFASASSTTANTAAPAAAGPGPGP
ncbi:MAG TPA: efflux RND transporter permease subunit [Steroidobacteraceae bacterium]|nr:efflux RND transporter permease subunit [Steroidobacteraceae bacterium]